MKTICVAAAIAVAGVGAASAAPITVQSYDVINGESGSYNYWDDTYNGTGATTVDRAPLSGGTGDLTDGVIATTGWVAAEAPTGPGPYVGWAEPGVPIAFDFGQTVSLDSMTVWFDDSDGAGGVDHIAAVNVLDLGQVFSFGDPAGSGATSQTIGLGGLQTSTLDIRIFGSATWIFVSEIQFDGTAPQQPVPVPGAVLFFGSAFPALLRLILRRR